MRKQIAGGMMGGLLWFGTAIAAPLGFTTGDEPVMEIRTAVERVRGNILRERATFESDPARFYAEVEAKLVPHFDLQRIAQIVLGRHWSAASEAQRQRFIETFKDHLVRSYSATLLQYEDSTELLWSSQQVEGRDPVVVMEVIKRDAAPIRVGLTVHQVDAMWKIYDVSAQGISMATNFRGQFNAVIKKEGLDALITRLQQHSVAQGGATTASGAP